MAKMMTFKTSFADQICNFTDSGITYVRSGYPALSYDYTSATPELKIYYIQIYSRGQTSNVAMTVELKIGNNTSGEITMPPRVIGGETYYEYQNYDGSLSGVLVPNSDSDLSVQIIIRIDGVAKTTNTFVIPPPLGLSVTSISPSPATGKACTVTLNKAVPNNSWKLSTKRIIIAAYYDDPVYRMSVYGYKTDMSTRVEYYEYGFSQFTFYVPYDSSKQRSNDQAKITVEFQADPDYDYFTFGTTYLTSTLEHVFTMSYINQTDPLAGPTVVLNAIAENPSGMMATYGKYIGGSIQKLTFSIASITYKFGSSFSKRTMSLYNSNGTLNKAWEYSNTNNFTLSLTNKVDAAYYMTVSITDSAGRVGSATTSTFQIYGYDVPSIISLNASRCDQDGTANDSGAYCKITYQFKVYALGNQNTKKVTLYAPDGSHVYTNLDYDHGSAYQYISAANTETSYQIDLTVEDDFDEATRTMNLSTAGVIMDFLYNGKGIGLGKVSETTNMVEVNPSWVFKANNITLGSDDLRTLLNSILQRLNDGGL